MLYATSFLSEWHTIKFNSLHLLQYMCLQPLHIISTTCTATLLHTAVTTTTSTTTTL